MLIWNFNEGTQYNIMVQFILVFAFMVLCSFSSLTVFLVYLIQKHFEIPPTVTHEFFMKRLQPLGSIMLILSGPISSDRFENVHTVHIIFQFLLFLVCFALGAAMLGFVFFPTWNSIDIVGMLFILAALLYLVFCLNYAYAYFKDCRKFGKIREG